jgi:hypothetical protein
LFQVALRWRVGHARDRVVRRVLSMSGQPGSNQHEQSENCRIHPQQALAE